MTHKFTIKQSYGKTFDINVHDSGRIECPDEDCKDKPVCKHVYLASSPNNIQVYRNTKNIRVKDVELERISNAWDNLPWYKKLFI